MGWLLLLCPLVVQAATLQAPPVIGPPTAQELLERVERVEAGARVLAAQPGAPVAAAQAPQMQVPEAAGGREYPNLHFQGFADVGYGWSDASGDQNAFTLGQFNLFITSTLSSRLSIIAEPVIKANNRNRVGIDLERLLLVASLSPHLQLSVGRYHTAIGWYNTAYHHSAWLQTAVGRPFLFEFGSVILPIHDVGLSATGRIPSGALNLRYIAEVGNGRASRSPLDEAVQNVKDENAGKAVNLGVMVRPDWLRDFQAGVSVYRDRLTPEGASAVGQTIFAGHAIYQRSVFEWLSEGMVIRNTVRDTGRPYDTWGFYTQIARQFRMVKPYFRYQFVDAPSDDPYFSEVGRMSGPSIGVRWDFSQLGAFKIQYDRTSRRGAASVNRVTTQLSFAF